MNSQHPSSKLEKATHIMANWLTGINYERLKSRASFAAAQAELRRRISDDDLLALAAIENIGDLLEHITGTAFCLTEHCDEFAEVVEDLLEDGSILQAHADLVHTIERHVLAILQLLDQQRVLATVLAETIGTEYTASPIVN